VDFEIAYTRPALKDLAEILAWSWGNHPGNTERFVSGLLRHVEMLRNFPRLGRPIRGFESVQNLHILHCASITGFWPISTVLKYCIFGTARDDHPFFERFRILIVYACSFTSIRG
jgi:hypothetical protein